MPVTAGALKQGLGLLQASALAVSEGLKNIPDDEEVVVDALALVMVIDPATAAVIIPAEYMLPLAVEVVEFVAERNTQGKPGSQTPDPKSGKRGS